MERKIITRKMVAFHHVKTTLVELSQFVGQIPNKIKDELVRQKVEMEGPQIWNYHGCDGNPNTLFDLDICFPVKTAGIENSLLSFKELDDFSCLCVKHSGPWEKLSESYQSVFTYIEENQLNITGNSREVYLVCDFENEDNCITEIQIEIN